MKPRGQFEARPKSAYAGGVLYYVGTQNKFYLPELFDFSLSSGYKLWDGVNWRMEASLISAPPSFILNGLNTMVTYNNPNPTSGQVMIVNFTYKILGVVTGTGGGEPLAQYSTKTSIKIVVH